MANYNVRDSGKFTHSTPARVPTDKDVIDALVSALESIKWKSVDRDNMEYAARITCFRKDAIDAALALARGEK